MPSEILFKRGIEVFPRLKAKGLALKTIKNKKNKKGVSTSYTYFILLIIIPKELKMKKQTVTSKTMELKRRERGGSLNNDTVSAASRSSMRRSPIPNLSRSQNL